MLLADTKVREFVDPIRPIRFSHSHLQDFLRSEKWYANRGIPYRRGYLLHVSEPIGPCVFHPSDAVYRVHPVAESRVLSMLLLESWL